MWRSFFLLEKKWPRKRRLLLWMTKKEKSPELFSVRPFLFWSLFNEWSVTWIYMCASSRRTFCVRIVCVRIVLCQNCFVSESFCVRIILCQSHFVSEPFCARIVLCQNHFVSKQKVSESLFCQNVFVRMSNADPLLT